MALHKEHLVKISSQLNLLFNNRSDFFEKKNKTRIFQKRGKTQDMILKNVDTLNNLRRHQMLPIPKGA